MRQTYQFILLLLTGVFFYSCQGDELSTQGNEGYLRVTLEQSAEVNTKADYKSKQMRVVIKNSAGVTKFETNDHTADLEGKELSLKQGEYTIEAVSNGWDGNAGADRAYYTGKTTVTIEKGKTATAKLVCSLANVKVTVAFEQDNVAINTRIAEEVLKSPDEPNDDLSIHCNKPYPCAFWKYCSRHVPSPSVFDLYRLPFKKKIAYYQQGMAGFDKLLQQGDYEGAKAYLSTLTKTIAANTTIMNTHNPLLDALLSKKYEEASRKGVMVYFDLPDLRDMPMGQTDLVIVLSNLLNNAIEAAAQADPPEVYVRMRKSEDEVVLSVRNRVEKDLNLADGQLPRISQKGAGHGFGLWNVRDVLKKYGGEYTISCRGCWFRFTCTIPLRKL